MTKLLTYRNRLYLGVIGVLGLSSLMMRAVTFSLIPTHFTPDSEYYHELAQNLVKGKGFSLTEGSNYRPVYEHTPGYSLWLALMYKLIPGPEELSNTVLRIKIIIIIQHGLSIGSSILFAWAFYRLTHQKPWTLVYLGLSLLYFPFMAAANFLLSESWGIFLLSTFFLGLTFLNRPRNHLLGLVLGLILGMAILVRPAAIVMLPAYAVWLWLYGKAFQRQRISTFSWIVLGVMTPLLIWVLRTGLVTKQWVPIQIGVTKVLISGGCPAVVCGIPYHSLPIKINPEFIPQSQNSSEFNPGNLWWWYGVKKIRDFYGFPYGLTEINKFNTGAVFGFKAGLFWGHTLIMMLAVWGGILSLRKKNQITLAVGLVMAGMWAHSLFWSEPRYALAYMPWILALTVFGFESLFKARFALGEKFNRNIWQSVSLLGLGIIWLMILMAPSPVGWESWRAGMGLMFWLLTLGMMLKTGFRRSLLTAGQKMVILVYILMMWGLLIALWQPVRLMLLPTAPRNDYDFPLGINSDNRQWL